LCPSPFWEGSEAQVVAKELTTETRPGKLPRRRFLRDATTVASVTCIAPSLLFTCQVKPKGNASIATNVEVIDEALEMMAMLGPLSNHGPMASEALVALGRTDRVTAFVEAYTKRFRSPYPESRQSVTRENWREALGNPGRFTDWTTFFTREMQETPWSQVLKEWSSVLAPGLSAAAAHGLIRTGHAVRSLSVKETAQRRRELAEGLSTWAAYYQLLPTAQDDRSKKYKPAQAIDHVPLLPTQKRASGSIMVGLRSLNDFGTFSNVANLVEPAIDPAQFLSEVTETFATAYLKNVTQRNFITLLHSVTGTTALRSILPYLSPAATQSMLRYGWQTGAALYSIAAIESSNGLPQAADIKRDDLIDRAVATQEEHAIKFTEACLREYALNPKLVYLQAAHDGVGRLRSFS
jgi:hypothetical protein